MIPTLVASSNNSLFVLSYQPTEKVIKAEAQSVRGGSRLIERGVKNELRHYIVSGLVR